jgi:hypothetical protein
MQLHPSTIVYSIVALAIAAYWIWFVAERYLVR